MLQTCFDSMVSLQTLSTICTVCCIVRGRKSACLPNAKHLHSVKEMGQQLEHFLDSGFWFLTSQSLIKRDWKHWATIAGQAVCLIGKSRCVSDPMLSLLVYKHHLRFGWHKTLTYGTKDIYL